MNKGLRKRNKKIQKNFKKMQEIKEEQEHLVRFIECSYADIKKVNGKYKFQKMVVTHGLQIKNRCYLPNGKYKMVNNRGFRIKYVYNTIPEWADDVLVSMYKDALVTV